jgi:hypothetical protein
VRLSAMRRVPGQRHSQRRGLSQQRSSHPLFHLHHSFLPPLSSLLPLHHHRHSLPRIVVPTSVPQHNRTKPLHHAPSNNRPRHASARIALVLPHRARCKLHWLVRRLGRRKWRENRHASCQMQSGQCGGSWYDPHAATTSCIPSHASCSPKPRRCDPPWLVAPAADIQWRRQRGFSIE